MIVNLPIHDGLSRAFYNMDGFSKQSRDVLYQLDITPHYAILVFFPTVLAAERRKRRILG